MDRRKEFRIVTREDVRATIAGVDGQFRLRNLSQSGCLIEGSSIPADIGIPIKIVLSADLSVDGQIAWQLGDSMGIFFDSPIALEVVRSFALDDWPTRTDWNYARIARET
ncbi:PilZ domain-containing protein [Qipengyuania sp. XHP0207]|uniref:PilZ domain-containing protein n=1 Tax=Qipengyuania sp. XHP0207 TaxID=3038078 RepID=UPI00241D87AA|nr:PilZ domain-containing protein [Qipengyuania sp. XHP0207]MDG5747827.1 PilZ domain-containing protein [Qipengyuania sp. XHP0207]